MKLRKTPAITHCSMISSGSLSKGGVGEMGIFSILERRTSVTDASMTLCHSMVENRRACQVDESRLYLGEGENGGDRVLGNLSLL